jgi:multidrug efflux pump subunit AcrA (membrane-fusion protein)
LDVLALQIHVSSKSIAIATLIVGTVMIGGKLTVALWQGAAPVSRQITLTRFIVTLNPDLKALIKTINVEIGEPVKKGDLLFELDKKQFQAPVDQYSAQLEAAKTEVDRLKAAVELSAILVFIHVHERLYYVVLYNIFAQLCFSTSIAVHHNPAPIVGNRLGINSNASAY